MRILYHHRLGSKDGQYVHVEELTHALRALGHELHFVAPASVEQESFGGESKFVSRLKRHVPRALYEVMEFCYSFAAWLKLRRAIRQFRPDVIYERYNLFFPAGIWAKRRSGLPLILEVNAPLYEERAKNGGIALGWLARWSERYTWRNADSVIAVTEVLAGHVRRAGAEPGRITVIPNGVDLQRFDSMRDRNALKAQLGVQGKLVLGFVGFIRPWHGLHRVVDQVAADEEHDAFLLAVGDGPARAQIETRARELGVENRVRVTGVVGRDAMPEHVATFDIALQPDVVPYASPLKLFEYMAMGCAIVAPDSDNIREILEHERDALLFDHRRPDTFGQAVQRLIDEPGLRERLGKGARETLERTNRTWRHNAEMTLQIADRLLAQGRGLGAQAGHARQSEAQSS
jgi:glycosyltransferase involved in cell wall biosynthesis